MRQVILLATLVLGFGVFVSGSALAAQGGSSVPFKASVSGTTTINLVTGQAHAVGTGTATHCGLFTYDESVQQVPTGPGTFDYVSSATVTCANGDQIFMTGAGTAAFTDPVHYTVVGDRASTGGTGRFADASLTFAATVHGTVLSVEGTIATSQFEATLNGQLNW